MKIKSFFIYTIGLQTITMLLLWGVWIAWLKYDYIPSIGKTLDEQQLIIAKGFANTLSLIPQDKPDVLKQASNTLENTYKKAMQSGNEDENYDPLVAIISADQQIIYTNKPNINLPILPDDVQLIDAEGEFWHIAGQWDDDERIQVVIGESVFDRRSLIGEPTSGTAIPLLFILATMLASTLITTYLSLRPIHHAANLISNRDPRNYTPLDEMQQYKEIRPVIREINQLMGRVVAANQREKQFMADAAHELRTPIAAVLAQLHLLKNIVNSTERKEIMCDMEKSLQRSVSLSHQLIDLAYLETEDFPLKIETLNVSDVISESIAQHVPYALKKNIELSLECSQQIIFKSDQQALLSIFNNILDNGIKYCPNNSHIEVTLVQNKPDNIQIIIRDDGIGIAPQYLTQLFSRFFRIPGNMQTGSGLGLAIAQNMAEKINARINTTDGLNGKGIGFIITIHENKLST